MLVPHDYWVFENAELNSAFKSFSLSAYIPHHLCNKIQKKSHHRRDGGFHEEPCRVSLREDEYKSAQHRN